MSLWLPKKLTATLHWNHFVLRAVTVIYVSKPFWRTIDPRNRQKSGRHRVYSLQAHTSLSATSHVPGHSPENSLILICYRTSVMKCLWSWWLRVPGCVLNSILYSTKFLPLHILTSRRCPIQWLSLLSYHGISLCVTNWQPVWMVEPLIWIFSVNV